MHYIFEIFMSLQINHVPLATETLPSQFAKDLGKVIFARYSILLPHRISLMYTETHGIT